jgi:cell division protease FtsH
MSQTDPTRHDEQDNRLGRISKNAAFLMMMALMLLFAIQVVGGQDDPVATLTYSDFTRHVSADRVDEVTFRDRAVTGSFKQPVRVEDRDFVRFRTMVPGDVSDRLLQELETRGVIVDAELPQRGVGTLLLQALPWLLFIAFWIWIFRTMQGGGNKAFQFGRSKAKLFSPDTP